MTCCPCLSSQRHRLSMTLCQPHFLNPVFRSTMVSRFPERVQADGVAARSFRHPLLPSTATWRLVGCMAASRAVYEWLDIYDIRLQHWRLQWNSCLGSWQPLISFSCPHPVAQALSLASGSRFTVRGPSSMARWLKGVPTTRLWKKTKTPEKSQRKRSGGNPVSKVAQEGLVPKARQAFALFLKERSCVKPGACMFEFAAEMKKTRTSLVFPLGCRKNTIPRPKQGWVSGPTRCFVADGDPLAKHHCQAKGNPAAAEWSWAGCWCHGETRGAVWGRHRSGWRHIWKSACWQMLVW